MARITVALSADAKRLEARFGFDRAAVDAIKAIPGRRWNPDEKCWWWRFSIGAVEGLENLGAALSPEVIALADYYRPNPDRPTRGVGEMTAVNVPDDYEWLAATPGRPHQIAASAWRRGHGTDGAVHPSCAFEMGMGLGKSLCVIEEILKLKSKQPDQETLVLAPNAVLREVWEKQIVQHAAGALSVVVLDGPMARRREVLTSGRHYDVWVHCHESLVDMSLDLAAHGWRQIVIDEHSKYRSARSERVKALLGYGRFQGHALDAPYKIALSGTPVIKHASDIYPTYKWLGAPTGTLAEFRAAYTTMGGYGGKEEIGLKPGGALTAMLNRFRFVVPKEAVLHIPRTFRTDIVALPAWQRARYEKVQEELRTLILGEQEGPCPLCVDGITPGTESSACGACGGSGSLRDILEERTIFNVLTLLLRLEQVAAGIESIGKSEETGKERYSWRDDNAKSAYLFDELLPEAQGGDDSSKVIVWAWFRSEIVELTRLANEKGYRAVAYLGGNQAAKQAAVEEFTQGGANVFVGQTAAAGLGLNLPQAQTMVYYSRSFDTEAYLQSLERNYRLNTAYDDLKVVVLEAADTVDQRITQVLAANARLAGTVSSLNPNEVLDIARLALGDIAGEGAAE